MHEIGNIVYGAVKANDVFAVKRCNEGLVELFVNAVACFVSTVLKIMETTNHFTYLLGLKVIAKLTQSNCGLKALLAASSNHVKKSTSSPLEEIKH